MTSKFQKVVLSVAVATGLIASPAAIATSADLTNPTQNALHMSKQNVSASSLCQAELRRRMSGTRSTVSISVLESVPSATTIRLAGQGIFNRGDGSRLQPFNFSCVVNIPQSRVSSLSYVFISN